MLTLPGHSKKPTNWRLIKVLILGMVMLLAAMAIGTRLQEAFGPPRMETLSMVNGGQIEGLVSRKLTGSFVVKTKTGAVVISEDRVAKRQRSEAKQAATLETPWFAIVPMALAFISVLWLLNQVFRIHDRVINKIRGWAQIGEHSSCDSMGGS